MKLTIGEKIAILRKEKDITQTELAEYLFLAPQTVSRWEVGNGAPEITLLPKIAAFFGVSIDELFGMTSLERADDLVSKYSVLRDERTFQEAMECVNAQLRTIDASLKSGAEDAAGLETDRDTLEAWKVHLWIQQGREAFKRALELVESFVEKTAGNPDHPWYLRMRLQRGQLRANIGQGREALAECRENFKDHPDELTLQIYFSMLRELQAYEEIRSVSETDSLVREIIFPITVKNLGIWFILIDAAAETGGTAFIEKHMPPILEVCTEEDEFSFLMSMLRLYKKEGQDEKVTALRRRLRVLLPGQPFNKYIMERTKENIEAF